MSPDDAEPAVAHRAASGHEGVGAQLASTVVSAAGPYGYTISLSGSTAMATGQLGSPNLGEALLLMLGAVAGFVAIETLTRSRLRVGATPDDRPPSIWGNAHVLSAGGALCLVWAIVRVLVGPLAWAAVGLAATVVYFTGTALQRVAVQRLASRRPAHPTKDPHEGRGH